MRAPFAIVLVGALGAAVLAGCLDSGTGRTLEDESEGLEPRGPIRLVGKDALKSAESGVRSGNGTRGDPYVISGWFIDLTTSQGRSKVGISLSDLDVHVSVRNCKVKRASDDIAIHIVRSKNVRIEHCKVVSGKKHGPTPPIASTDLAPPTPNLTAPTPTGTVTSPTATAEAQTSSSAAPTTATEVTPAPEPAVHVEDSTNITVTETIVEGDGADDGGAPLVVIEDSSGVVLEGSQVTSGSDGGVHVEGSTNVTVSDTQITGNQGNGVALSNSTAVTVANNSISQNGGDGVHAENVGGSTVADNQVTDNGGYGVAVGGTQNQVVQNDVVGNGAGGGGGILLETGSTMVFANGVHDNENYGIVVMPETQDVQLADNSATGDDGGDKIIVPDPQDPSVFSGPNEGQVEAPGPGFDPRPPPKGNSPGLGVGVFIAALLLALGAAGLWWVRRGR